MTISGTDRARAAYFDSSALLKIVQAEPESDALRATASGLAWRASSELAVIEVRRRSRRFGPDAEEVAGRVLNGTVLRPIDAEILERAALLDPLGLRSLDAIHLATALSIEPLDAFISYDRRLNEAASAAGLNVVSPA